MADRDERDVWVLMASRGVRSFAYSCLNVIFAIYLSQLGYSTVTIGIVISTAYVSSAILTVLWGYLSDRYGRRRILMLLAALTMVSNTIYVFFSQLVFIFIAVIVTNIGAGGTGGGGQGGGPFNPVEQALLAEKCTPENRNRIFSLNAFVGSILGSLGALFSGLPEYLQQRWGWEPILSYKPLFVVTIVLSCGLIFAYGKVSERHVPRAQARERKPISKQSGAFVTKLSLLGMIDNLGAGMVGPLISYWFYLRFGVDLKSLGFMFFISYLLAALSFLAAPMIARRVGVVRTMVFSHGLASLVYFVLPFAPTFWIGAGLIMFRSFVAYMDGPLKGSFVMGIVKAEERGSAAGITNLSRYVPMAVSPSISAYIMQAFSLSVPIFIGGALQFAHDVTFYFLFRHVRPPEEEIVPATVRAT
ncbi:MAG TPA: MFS transporter [Verrucomicrobiae bacterium]|nr:MFS transporter [Verrucomicrobiae bacterium]